ncbi:MAG: hypothetical protein ACK476_13180 [Fluviicola sp.]|jgi:hypothetical protein
MKKFILLLCLSFSSISFSQDQGFRKGQVTLSPGFGLGLYGNNYSFGLTVPVMANLDIGFHDYFSFGFYGGYWSQRWNSLYYYGDYRFTSTHFGGRISAHFMKLVSDILNQPEWSEKIDIYVTPWVGYNLRSSTWLGDGTNPENLNWDNRIQVGAQLGVRYYLKPRFAVFAEWGGTPTAYSNWGLTLRF